MPSAAHTSRKQRTANRRNAEHSTGPRTEAGKKRTSLNNLSHGLTGQTVVMPHEDRALYETFRITTIENLQPADNAERALAQSIADDTWRLNRARAIEENIFSLDLANVVTQPGEDPQIVQALTQAQTFLTNAREIQLLTLYAGRIVRALAKSHAELNALQTHRKKARAAALEEAILLAQHAQSKSQIYNPAADFPENGFGFSTAEINRIVDRRRRLVEAIAYAKTSRKAA